MRPAARRTGAPHGAGDRRRSGGSGRRSVGSAAGALAGSLLVGSLLVGSLLAGCGGPQPVITTLDEASTARIGVMTGSTGETLAAARFPAAAIKSFDDIMDAVAAMSSGQLDAAVTGYPAALQVAKTNPQLRLLDEPLDDEDTAVAVRKDDAALLEDLDRSIEALRTDGTLEAMRRRWFKTEEGP